MPLRVSRRELTVEVGVFGVLTTIARVGLGTKGFVDEFGDFVLLVTIILSTGDCGASDPTCPLGPFNVDNNELTHSDPVAA